MRRIAPLAAAALLLPLWAAAQPATTTPPAGAAETVPLDPSAPLPGVERIEGFDPAAMLANSGRLTGGGALPVISSRRAAPGSGAPAAGGKVIQLPAAGAPPADPLPGQGPAILRPGTAAAPASGSGEVAAAVQALAFTPDPAIRADMRADVATSFPAAEVTAEMSAFRTAVVRDGYDEGVRGYLATYGLSPDNVADSTALYLATAWLVVNGGTGDPSPAQMRGLRDQLALTFQDAGTDEADAAYKQRLAEANLITAALLSQAAGIAVADEAVAETIRQQAAALVRDTFGLDLGTLQLTDTGLR